MAVGHANGPRELAWSTWVAVLVALRAVSAGEVLAIAASGDDEYDEWELDPSTGEMARVDRNGSGTDKKNGEA